MPLERRLQVVEAYVRRQTGRAVRVQTIGFGDLSRADMVAMSRVLNAGTGEFPVVFVGNVVACTGDYDLAAIVDSVTAQPATGEAPPVALDPKKKETSDA
jgi:hypothetical protein